jgi:uncharacterized protein YcfJ
MKKILTALATVIFASSANAGQTVYATVISVTENPAQRYVEAPVQTCTEVQVPIYRTVRTAPSSGDALTGAIIGGIIGNQFGSGSGRDAMTALGAIVGANSATGRTYQELTGYHSQYQCTTSYTGQLQTVISYTLVVRWNGNTSVVYSDSHRRVGDVIPIQVN